MEFDYERAFDELALPEWQRISQDDTIRTLWARVSAEAADLSQLHDLSMPWPDPTRHVPGYIYSLRAMFDRCPSKRLALAARVCNDAGHWAYGGGAKFGPDPLGKGISWKFAHYADQTLRERLGVSDSDLFVGFAVRIFQGTCRICYSSNECWTWAEVSPADEAGYDYARALAQRWAKCLPERTRDRDRVACDLVDTFLQDGTRAYDWEDPWPRFLEPSPFMVPHGTLTARHDERRRHKEVAT